MNAHADQCPVCSSPGATTFLVRDQVPVHQNYICSDRAEAVGMQRGRLEMAICGGCGFVFNRAFDPGSLKYGGHYENSQMCSPRFDDYVAGLVQRIGGSTARTAVFERLVVEVGCGNGTFLRRLMAALDSTFRGEGYDPAYSGAPSEQNGRLKFYRQYFGPETVNTPADLVVCRHVIEHIADPIQFLRSIRRAVSDAGSTRLYFETPCVDWILNNDVFWDFFYEHCSLFTAESLTAAFEIAGFHVLSVEHVFGGQYLWLEACLAGQPTLPRAGRQDSKNKALDLGLASVKRIHKWQEDIVKRRSDGRIVVWGAGAKGVTFANLVDPDATLLDGVVDINPAKQGGFLPGTGHRILSPEQLDRSIATALVLNPNYVQEISIRLQELGLVTNVVSIM